MKNYFAGFFLSAFFHLGVVALVINFDSKNAPKPSQPEEIELSLSVFEEELVKETPVEAAKPEPIEIPKVADQISPEPEPVKQSEIVAEILAPPIIKKAAEATEKKLVEKKQILKPAPVKKQAVKKVVKKPVKKTPQKKITVSKPNKVVPKKVPPKKIVKKKRPIPVKKVPHRKVVKRRPKPTAVVRRLNPTRAKSVKPQRKIQRPQAKTQIAAGAAQKRKPQAVVRPRPIPKPAINSAHLKKIENTYKNRLRQLIAKNKRYPKRAIRRRNQGTVYVSFVISANGQISQVRAAKSSGYAVLDKAAIKAIKAVSGRLPIPKELKKTQWRISIPVTYKLR